MRGKVRVTICDELKCVLYRLAVYSMKILSGFIGNSLLPNGQSGKRVYFTYK